MATPVRSASWRLNGPAMPAGRDGRRSQPTLAHAAQVAAGERDDADREEHDVDDGQRRRRTASR